MLVTSFEPLSDDEFRQLVASGLAIPGRTGSGLFVAKWRDGPGLDPDVFLAGLRAQGSKLEVRRFKGDVNIRIVRGTAPIVEVQGSPPRARTVSD